MQKCKLHPHIGILNIKMSAEEPTQEEKDGLQGLYLACRGLLQGNVSGKIFVQKSFEEMLYGFLGEYAWRPTHASVEALREVTQRNVKNIQRAHGILEGHLDRYERTMQILLGPAQEFDDWWKYYRFHDTTVLITRQEHSKNKKFVIQELVELPEHSTGLFASSGFSFKVRKNFEIKWAKSTLEKLTCPGTIE